MARGKAGVIIVELLTRIEPMILEETRLGDTKGVAIPRKKA